MPGADHPHSPIRRAVSISIPAEHPALPGHFPGEPIVPGVVILGELLDAAESELGPFAVAGLAEAKFLAPLLPGELARGLIEADGARLRFEVTRGDRAIAKGTFNLAAGTGAPGIGNTVGGGSA
ncbi:MAG: hypothetical protein ACREU3_13725 [Steroidobacteraceae bacterium]